MGRPNKYPEEFRREAVELYRSSDRSRSEVPRGRQCLTPSSMKCQKPVSKKLGQLQSMLMQRAVSVVCVALMLLASI